MRLPNIHTVITAYPRAFWILLACFFANRIGGSLIWPFIGVYMTQQTDSPMTTYTGLLSVQAVVSIFGTSFISSLMDRYGRKKLMILGLVAFSSILMMMSGATELWQWVILLPVYGIVQPIFTTGAYAMIADLIPDEQRRTDAYALLRTVANLAISIGPIIGGALIARSYLFAYFGAGTLNLLLIIPLSMFLMESMGRYEPGTRDGWRGYLALAQDKPFIQFMVVFLFIEMATAMIFSLLSIYTKEQFGIPEGQIGQIIAVNALMVVLFQLGITRITRRFPPYLMMATGSLFYVVALLGYWQATTATHFLAGMIVLTIGEMIVMPTATAMVARLAPADMRARYMGLYSLMYTIGAGIGPALGGAVSSVFGPPTLWLAAASSALICCVGFVILSRSRQRVSNLEPVHERL
jgi:MFS family permease